MRGWFGCLSEATSNERGKDIKRRARDGKQGWNVMDGWMSEGLCWINVTQD